MAIAEYLSSKDCRQSNRQIGLATSKIRHIILSILSLFLLFPHFALADLSANAELVDGVDEFLLHRAIEKNDVSAMEKIGDSYFSKNGAIAEPEIAIHWYNKAADTVVSKDAVNFSKQINSQSRVRAKLSKIYSLGIGTTPKRSLSSYWARKAVDYTANSKEIHKGAYLLNATQQWQRLWGKPSNAFGHFIAAKTAGGDYPKYIDPQPNSTNCSDLLRGREYLRDAPDKELFPIPLDVWIRATVKEIKNIDTASKEATVKFGLSHSHEDYRLIFDPKNFSGSDLCLYNFGEIEKAKSNTNGLHIWQPDISIDGIYDKTTFEKSTTAIYSNGYVEFLGDLAATVTVDMDLSRFPFVIQTLQLKFQPDLWSEAGLKFFSSGETDSIYGDISEIVVPTDWDLLSVNQKIASEKQFSTTSVYEVDIEMRRNPFYYVVNLFFPMVLIFLISNTHFWFPMDKLDAKVTVALSALVAIIAYQFIIQDELPKLSYMTNLDSSVMATIVFIAFNIFTIAVNQYLIANRKIQFAQIINFHARYVFVFGWLFSIVIINFKAVLLWNLA